MNVLVLLASIATALILVYPIFKLSLVIKHRFVFGTCDKHPKVCHRVTYNHGCELLTCELCGTGFDDSDNKHE